MRLKISAIFLFFIFAGLLFLYFISIPLSKYNRYTLYLINYRTGKEGTEARYVLKTNIKTKEQQFVEELILGPMRHDFYDYFEKTTRYDACFVDNGTLYVSFPVSVLSDVQSKMPFERFYELFKKNIFANFSHIKKVSLFINGIEAYEKDLSE